MPVYSIFVHNIIIEAVDCRKLTWNYDYSPQRGLQPPFLAQLCFFSLRGLLNTFQACWPDAVCFSCYSVCACECLQGRVVSLCCSCTDSSRHTKQLNQPITEIILTLLLHFCSLLYLFFHILSYFSQHLSLFCCMQCISFFLCHSQSLESTAVWNNVAKWALFV